MWLKKIWCYLYGHEPDDPACADDEYLEKNLGWTCVRCGYKHLGRLMRFDAPKRIVMLDGSRIFEPPKRSAVYTFIGDTDGENEQ